MDSSDDLASERFKLLPPNRHLDKIVVGTRAKIRNFGLRKGRSGGWAGALLVLAVAASFPALVEQTHLIEIIYELDLHAPEGRPLPSFETAERKTTLGGETEIDVPFVVRN